MKKDIIVDEQVVLLKLLDLHLMFQM